MIMLSSNIQMLLSDQSHQLQRAREPKLTITVLPAHFQSSELTL